MKLNWRKPALWAALTVATVGAAALAAEADGPDVTPTYFALPLQPATGNPVTCMENTGSTLGLGYPMGVKLDGKGTGTWDIYLPSDETGSGTAVPSGDPAPGGGLSFAGTIVVTDVVGDNNAINFYNDGTFLGVSGVIIKAGSGGSPQSSSVYPYEQPPASIPVPGPNNDLVDYGWPDPYPGGYPGPQIEDDNLDSPAGITQGISHIEFCFFNSEPIVRPPNISKTADGTWIRYHDWTLNKEVDPEAIEMFNGDTHDVDYTITAAKDPWGNFTVSGVIELSDPLDQGFTVDSVADTIIFDADAANTPFHPTLNCANVDDGSDVFHRCTYSITLSSKTYSFLAGGTGGVNTAVAQVSLDGQPVLTDPTEATANFLFPAEPSESFGDELVLDDTMVPGAPDHTFTDDGVFQYPHTFACPDDEGDNPNTATGTYTTGPGTTGEVVDQANVNVDCHVVTVTKTALTRFHRDFDWTPEKKIVVRPQDLTVEDKTVHCSLLGSGPYVGNYLCDDITIELLSGSVYDTVYSLTATKDAGTDSGQQVYGVITVSWPADAPEPVFTGDPTDVLQYAAGLPASINATVSNCVLGTNEITCDYVADVGDDRSGINEASIVRPWVCYNADETTKVCAVPGESTYTGSQAFSFGAPTTTADDCVALSDLFNGTPGLNLGAGLFPEGTVIDPLCNSATLYRTATEIPGIDLDILADWAPPGFEQFTPACTFYVPNLLKLALDDGLVESDEAVIGVFVSDACNQGCTLTQGYWKTHAIFAAKPQFTKKRDDTWDLVGAQAENTTFFLSGTSWINVFWTPPKGNAYYNLAHQYMAAKLNGYAGASVPADVAAAIADAEAWFSLYPPSHTFWKTNKNLVITTAGLLASYNEGSTGPGHCSEAPQALVLMVK
ncbi:hypothetical protein [Lysobacter sp. CFH 32150]|uniref:hypothetical protein n=1 Tax=Lysobacter sp. CFH 32150 TaxID=2927128 RepID=UPI001FA70523|nr:hypothetical protein [Lysobacter sp. CFH 32150]MCI4568635.1 hypothetical protein [Lysobacter sp. CFH 32150]